MTDLYKDAGAGIGERVADLLGRMTLEEKVAQLGAIWLTSLVKDEALDEDLAAEQLADGIGQVTRIGASTGLLANESAALGNAVQRVLVERTRLGIPMVIHEEGVGGFLSRGATTFPQGLGLAATWDTELVGEVADVIRAQMLAVGARHNLAPVLDIARDPRWGRVEETYGESPELTRPHGRRLREGHADRRPRATAWSAPASTSSATPSRRAAATRRRSISAPESCARSTPNRSPRRSATRAWRR